MADHAASPPRKIDVAIVGGGIAGLWILDRLRRDGVDARLFERGQLGAGQTGRSQGIVHRGAKYLLRGGGDGFPDLSVRWQACLDGASPLDPDLRSTKILAPSVWLSSPKALPTAIETRLAAASGQGLVERAGPGAPSSARYRLIEPVLDVPSLLASLAAPHRAHLYLGHDAKPRLDGDAVRLHIHGNAVEAGHLILAAGEGNEQLLQELGLPGPAMVRRPLHMTWLHPAPNTTGLPPVWQHVLEPEAATGRPDADTGGHFTVTSHPRAPHPDASRTQTDSWSWYVGGDPSEIGVERSEDEQIRHIRHLLERHFPAVDFDRVTWSTLYINRCEPAGPRRLEPFVHRQGRVITVWPMKLALAPLAADRASAMISESS